MLEQNDNVLLDSTIKQKVKFNVEDKQITFLDTRFYKRNGKFYPSITYVLGFIPKNHIFMDWLKETGEDSEIIVKKAAEKGKQVHTAVEKLVGGQELNWINSDGSARYSLEVWQMILKFAEFWKIHQPKLISTELHVFSDKHEFAGTIDLVIELNNETWIIDVKTSNQVVPVYHYQTAAYQQCFEECYDKKVDRRGILWLKSMTRTEDKTGKKIRGKGWNLIESDRSFDKDFESFQLAKQMYHHESTYSEPYTEIYPVSIKL